MSIKKRNEILKPYFLCNDWLGGINRFEKVSLEVMEQLIEAGYLDPSDKQNESPTAGQFFSFMKEFSNDIDITAHGYVVSEERSDCRVTIEGLEGEFKNYSKELEEMIKSKFSLADEFEIDEEGFWFWYD